MAHVTFIHGIGNKPEQKELLTRWRRALANAATPLDLSAEGVTSEMVYWADVLYAEPVSSDTYEESSSEGSDIEGVAGETEVVSLSQSTDTDESLWISAIAQRLGTESFNLYDHSEAQSSFSAPEGSFANELERIPLPWVVKKEFLRRFIRDVHHYLFNSTSTPRPGETYEVQTEIRKRFIEKLKLADGKAGPHIVVSHSMGTVIAYDCLKRVPECPCVDALITIGSPLGIDEIQDKLKPEWSRNDGFPQEKVISDWNNFFDPLDIVSRLDTHLANDYKREGVEVILDQRQSNDGLWRHDVEKYLKGREVSSAIEQLLEG
ncbi:alpha/beta hydrolase [Mariprofundus ferrooxydans]|uniref:Serine protease, subtilase family protein n=1 Tax=Mariprofundus ferrooxydans PV-1 TaxID=314345 RepID=Q0EZU2_9PROT|nr:alpha/beta hydrolase [Mariprofundus ferrooxydans]EAU54942.1 Serine protease, subtilase family protein [Mariprofundus ferrooxydans PV-1]KON46498.1 hypothetical protein AL013_12805 [Mariprofundus ferrooxydans]